MSNHTEGISVVLLSNRELCRMLDDAEREERSLSDRRKELHALIDDLSVNAPEDDFELVTLSQKEQSSQRSVCSCTSGYSNSDSRKADASRA